MEAAAHRAYVCLDVWRVSGRQIDATLARAAEAQALWRKVPVKERIEYCRRFVTAFVSKKADIALELTKQMGRYNLAPLRLPLLALTRPPLPACPSAPTRPFPPRLSAPAALNLAVFPARAGLPGRCRRRPARSTAPRSARRT